MLDYGVFDSLRGAEPLLLLLGALVLDAYLGEMGGLFRRLPHPVAALGNLIALFDRKLNREDRGTKDRAVRGLLVVLIIGTGAVGLGLALGWLGAHHPLAWILELVVLVIVVAQRSLYDHVRAVAKALRSGGVEPGRQAVAHIVGRDPAYLDEHGVARAALESCAENFSDGVVAPVFWYLLLGFPGMLLYKAVNTMDSMIGHRTPRYRAFGFAAARLDDLMNLIPARLSGLLIALAAIFVPAAKPGAALKVMLRDARKHASPNAGRPIAAMAGALGLALAGPRRYREAQRDDPWLGDGQSRARPRHIDQGLLVYLVACLLQGLIVAGLAIGRLA